MRIRQATAQVGQRPELASLQQRRRDEVAVLIETAQQFERRCDASFGDERQITGEDRVIPEERCEACGADGR